MSASSPARVLVVDDDPVTLSAHKRIVSGFGHTVETASDGVEALAKLPLDVDFILLDGEMPNMDGFEVVERVRADPEYAHIPIVMVTGLTRRSDRRRAIEVGVNDFIEKPVDPEELELRARWLLEMKTAFDRLRGHERDLERNVERKTRALRRALEHMTDAQRLTHEAHVDTIRRLTVAAEYKDEDTAGHIERIGLYSEVLARALDFAPREVEIMRHAAPMHDVGKLGVPDRVLLKPGKLDADEWEIMRSHTKIGADILSGANTPLLQMGERIAISHHERWDGRGYPYGMAGEDIPIEGRICAVVDVFDALTMDRPYRGAVPVDDVLTMMREEAGKHFDPTVLEAFMDVIDAMVEIHQAGGA